MLIRLNTFHGEGTLLVLAKVASAQNHLTQ